MKYFVWLIFLVCVCIFWEASARNSATVSVLISSPFSIAVYCIEEWDGLLFDVGVTAAEAVLGLLIANTIAIVFWLISFLRPAIGQSIYPVLLGSQVIPFVCLAPFIVLTFGFGMSGKVVLSAIMSFFPIVTNLLVALRNISEDHFHQMKMLAVGKIETLWTVVRPNSLSYFFAAQRTAVPFAVIGAIVAEFSGADAGVGRNLYIAARRFEPEQMMANLLLSVCVSAFLYGLVLLVESRLGNWYWENRK